MLLFKQNLFGSTFTWYFLFSMYRCSSYFKSVDKILCFYHVNESSLAEHLNRTIFVQRNNERNLAAIRHKG